MSLACLPTELLLEIFDHLDDLAALSRLSRCNRWLFRVLGPRLYQYSHEHAGSVDMQWAMNHNTDHPLRRRPAYNLPWLPNLYEAASRGSDRVLSFILELSKKLPFALSDVLGHSLTVASNGGHVAAVR